MERGFHIDIFMLRGAPPRGMKGFHENARLKEFAALRRGELQSQTGRRSEIGSHTPSKTSISFAVVNMGRSWTPERQIGFAADNSLNIKHHVAGVVISPHT